MGDESLFYRPKSPLSSTVLAYLGGPCVFPLHDLPEPDISLDARFSGTGPGLAARFNSLFGTPIAVHWHHVRGPSPEKLAKRLPAWTDERISLASSRPA